MAIKRKEPNNAQMRRYWRLRDAGLCIRCGKDSKGRTRCRDCSEAYNEKYLKPEEYRIKRKQAYQEMRSKGICIDCRSKNNTGMVRCVRCHAKANDAKDLSKISEYSRKRYQEKKAAGICVKCPNPAAEGYVRCIECIERAYMADRS